MASSATLSALFTAVSYFACRSWITSLGPLNTRITELAFNVTSFYCVWEVSPKSWSNAIIPVNDGLVIGHRVVEGRLLVAEVWRIVRALVKPVIRKSHFSSPFLPIPADCIPLTAAASGTATTGRQGSLSLCRGALSPMPQKAKRVQSVRYMMIWSPTSVIKTMS